jgi:FkbM family methyltransferase
MQSIEATSSDKFIPSNLRKLGLELFKNEIRFNEVLSNMSKPVNFDIKGIQIILVQNKNDDSVQKLKIEFLNGLDGYGFSRIGTSNYGSMIDIGANIGCMSIYIAKVYPNWRIISFEPAPVTYFYFQYNMFLNNITTITGLPGRNESGGIRAINSAVGTHRSIMEFTYSDYNSQLATFSDILDGVNGWHKVNITVVSITNIIAHYSLDFIDFFKIDCEGCEFEVIPSIHSQFIDKNKIRFVGAEIHQSLLPQFNKITDDPLARRRDTTTIINLRKTLKSRGCSSEQWTTKC